MTELPTDPAAKLAMLTRAYGIGERIRELARPGARPDALRDFASNTPELELENSADGFALHHPGGVTWGVFVGTDGLITGLGTSGYGPLMQALGIDFSGADYIPGN